MAWRTASTRIIQELELENIYRNPSMNYSIWDSVLYQAVREEKNIVLLLNCSCLGCEMREDRIASVTGWQLNSYLYHEVRAKIFLDCSGDQHTGALVGGRFPPHRARKHGGSLASMRPRESADRHTPVVRAA